MPCISMHPSPVATTIGWSGWAIFAPMASGMAPPIGPRPVREMWVPGWRTVQYSANHARCAPESTDSTVSSGNACRSSVTTLAGCIGTAALRVFCSS